jgi:hypothetical protein
MIVGIKGTKITIPTPLRKRLVYRNGEPTKLMHQLDNEIIVCAMVILRCSPKMQDWDGNDTANFLSLARTEDLPRTIGELIDRDNKMIQEALFSGEIMVTFHIWDFSERIEFQIDKEMIERLKQFKAPKVTTFKHYRTQNPNTLTTVTRYYWIFPMKNVIGKRLFSDKDFHRNGIREHHPFVNIKHLKEISRKTGITLEELEKSVTHIRTSFGTKVRLKMRFPIESDVDWAFLFGLWFSSGGYITRNRNRASQEYMVRYAVDHRVFRELVKPILLNKFGYEDFELSTIWYTNSEKGSHKLDQHLYTDFGAEPRPFFALHRPIREIMEKFGLPPYKEALQRRNEVQGKASARQFNRTIPNWIMTDEKNMHSFVEGILNGQSAASQFHASYNKKTQATNITRFVEPRFHGKDYDIVEKYFDQISSFLETEYIHGYKHYLPLKHKNEDHPSLEIGYMIFGGSLHQLFTKYRLMRSDMRARLILNEVILENPALFQICKELTAWESLVLGAIIEAPQADEDLTRDLRCEPSATKQAIEKLQSLKLIKKTKGAWIMQKYAYKKSVIEALTQKEELRRQKLQENGDKFFSICNDCATIVDYPTEEACTTPGCKGTFGPIARHRVALKQQIAKSYIPRIEKIVKAKNKPSSFSLGCPNNDR